MLALRGVVAGETDDFRDAGGGQDGGVADRSLLVDRGGGSLVLSALRLEVALVFELVINIEVFGHFYIVLGRVV